jgi:serine/threonine protein kinase
LDPLLTRFYFKQLLNAVDHLHSTIGVSHLDIKLENILLDSDFTLKLCDFGFSDDVSLPVRVNKGTDGYKAPEIY